MTTEQEQESDLPREAGRPARDALRAVGCVRLAQVATYSEAELKAMHGIGPKAIEALRRALAAQGLAFAEPSSKK